MLLANTSIFLDSDDEITCDCIEKLVAPLSKNLYDFVIGRYRTIGGKKPAPPLSLNDGTALCCDDIIRSYYKGGWYMMVCGKLCNVAFLKQNNLFLEEGLLHEDELWSFQLACLAQSMYVVNQESYIYKIREGSITMNSKTQEHRAIAFQKIISIMVDFVLERQIKSKYAHLKILGMLLVLNEKLSEWTGKSEHEQQKIIRHQRENLSRIPYIKRLSCCMLSPKKMIRYGAVLLPVAFYQIYNEFIDRLINKCIKKFS